MTNRPMFSVIIPTYNRLTLCKETLTSVLEQSFKDYEVFVIDDGSTDGTQEYFSTFTHPNLKYVFQENAGVSTARNLGISHSTGEYICYLDSDDIWHEDKLIEINNFINEYPNIDVVFHDFKKHDIKLPEPYNVSNSDMFPYVYDFLSQQHGSLSWLGDSTSAFKLVMRGYPFYPSVVTVKRSVHKQYLWDPGVLKSEDFNLILKLSLKYSFGYLDKNLTVVKVHDNNKSADTLTKDRVILNTMQAITSLYCSGTNKKIAIETLATRKYYSGLGQIKRGNIRIGLTWLLSALSSVSFYRAKLGKLLK